MVTVQVGVSRQKKKPHPTHGRKGLECYIIAFSKKKNTRLHNIQNILIHVPQIEPGVFQPDTHHSGTTKSSVSHLAQFRRTLDGFAQDRFGNVVAVFDPPCRGILRPDHFGYRVDPGRHDGFLPVGGFGVEA